MRCQRCNQREATIHVAHLNNGMLRELHLCGECASRQFMPDMLTGKQLLEQLMKNQSAADLRCPNCDTTLADFQKTGYVGCPSCYGVFAKEMEPMLLAVHGATRHGGASHARDERQRMRDQRWALREALNDAVREERYEQAAALRDELRALEGEVKG